MNISTDEEIKNLNNNTLAIIILIILSFFNIYGNSLEKKSTLSNNSSYSKSAKNIFIISLVIAIIVYLYFTQTIYKSILEETNTKLRNLKIVRIFGAIFIIIGFSILLYYRINEKGIDEATPI